MAFFITAAPVTIRQFLALTRAAGWRDDHPAQGSVALSRGDEAIRVRPLHCLDRRWRVEIERDTRYDADTPTGPETLELGTSPATPLISEYDFEAYDAVHPIAAFVDDPS